MKILIATDGSAEASRAVQGVAARPWPAGTSARLLSVVQPAYLTAGPEGMSAALLEQMESQNRADVTRGTAAAVQKLKEAGLTVDTKVRRGDPRSEIVDEASEWASDLVVLGSKGRTGLGRWLLGSVAEGVVRHAPCSVEVVREKGAVAG